MVRLARHRLPLAAQRADDTLEVGVGFSGSVRVPTQLIARGNPAQKIATAPTVDRHAREILAPRAVMGPTAALTATRISVPRAATAKRAVKNARVVRVH